MSEKLLRRPPSLNVPAYASLPDGGFVKLQIWLSKHLLLFATQRTFRPESMLAPSGMSLSTVGSSVLKRPVCEQHELRPGYISSGSYLSFGSSA